MKRRQGTHSYRNQTHFYSATPLRDNLFYIILTIGRMVPKEFPTQNKY